MSKDFEGLLEAAFPKSTWKTIVRAQQEGIALADDVRKSTPLLNNLLGLDLRGHLRRIGVMIRLEQLCKSGQLPFGAAVDHMPHGSWHWLNLRSGSFVAHIARTDTFAEIPEETKNRQDYLLKNEGDLFDDPKIIPISELTSRVDRFYAYLTFGAAPNGKMTHSALGMAASDNKEWLALINLLRSSRDEAETVSSPLPKVDPKDRIKFHEHVEEILKLDHDRTNKKE